MSLENTRALVSCPQIRGILLRSKWAAGWGNVSAYRRMGVSASGEVTLLFGTAMMTQEVSTKLATLCKRRHADTPIRPYVSPSRPIFTATLWAGASWLFFCVARSTRMTQIWVLYRQSGSDRFEKQPTDLRQNTSYFGDRTLASGVGGHAPKERQFICPHSRFSRAQGYRQSITRRTAAWLPLPRRKLLQTDPGPSASTASPH